ncbi:MAG: tRNA (N(6)-L-threonylcarbamoyladenosine(37)-C(2))-methylthiotransferase [Desulfurococcaceae archaeon]
MRVYIETYGCALNKSDEILMKYVLHKKHHEVVDSLEKADVIVINTCIVRLDTEYNMINRIKKLREHCIVNNKKLVIAGCMAKVEPYLIAKIAPEASLISPQNANKIDIVVETNERLLLLDGIRERDLIGVYIDPCNRVLPIPIQEGCLNNCSFCIARYARRVLVSHSTGAIVRSIKEAVEKGAVEIELTGMDLGSYGIDLYRKRMLPKLLSEIVNSVKGNYMIRIGMINPEHMMFMLDELLEVIKNSNTIYKFLHIPLQSGSDKLLKIMRRNYTVDDYRRLVKEIRNKIPGISIATDIIIGHPFETEEDFEETLKIIRELEFERVHLAGYSIRPLTLSASMPQISTRIKKERIKRALDVIVEIGLKVHGRYIHRSVKCYVTEKNTTWVCRLENYIPVVVENNIQLNFGEWINVYINEATFYDLRGFVNM